MTTYQLPLTSREAYRSIPLAECEAAVLAYVRSQGAWGSTADQCEAAIGWGHQRFVSLRRKGLLRHKEHKATPYGPSYACRRETRSGRRAYVYVAVER